MGGNTFPILDDILSTGTNYVACNVETDQASFVESVTRTHPHVKIRVNLDPGSGRLSRTRTDLPRDRSCSRDGRTTDQLRDGHRRVAAGNAPGEHAADPRVRSLTQLGLPQSCIKP